MFKAIILPLAKQDIKEAAHWYNKRQPGLGRRFTQHVRQKVNFIRQTPKAVSVRYDNVRTAVLDVFPYMVHFVQDEENQLVIISAVLHTAQDPENWHKRDLDI
jgi:plasmid stabilization system protein ParE